MRILQVVHRFPPRDFGGTEIYTHRLSVELSKKHQVYVLYPTFGKSRCILNHLKRNGLNIYELSIPFTERIMRLFSLKSTYLDAKVEEKFRELLIQVKPDCIHFQHLIDLSASLIKIAKEEGIPTILTLHDYWFICPTTLLLKDNSTLCSGPDKQAENCFGCWNNRQAEIVTQVLGKCATPKMYPEKLIKTALNKINSKKEVKKRNEYLKSILLKVDRIIVPSIYIKKVFIKFGISQTQILYSSNGYNSNAYIGSKKKKHKNLIFGFVGKVTKSKGIEVLIKAFNETNPGNLELRIYGNYDQNLKFFKSLQKKVKKSNIKFMGAFEDSKNPYSEIDLLIVPSIWCETGGPLVVKEAFATETPVIASNIGCIPEFVRDGVNGFLFEAGNSQDLLKKIKTIIDNPRLIAQFQKNITPPRSIEDQSRELEEIYATQRCKYV